MNTNELNQVLDSVKPEFGEWYCSTSKRQISINWRLPKSEWQEDWDDDAPWTRFGGDELIEKIGLGMPDDGGSEEFRCRGTEYVGTWAIWWRR